MQAERPGHSSGKPELTSNDPSLAMGKTNIAVSCRGTVANFELSVDKIDFMGNQQAGQCSGAQYVTVKTRAPTR